MAYHVELQIVAKTDVGLVRQQNEDSVVHDLETGLVILADGMGVYNAGEVASAIATTTLKDTITGHLREQNWDVLSHHSKLIQQMLIGSVERANSTILQAARSEPLYSGMGTTLVAAIFYQNRLTIAHVGDSRAYRLRRGELDLITRDHSLLQEQIDAGLVDPEWARFSINRNLITRAVGVDHSVEVEVHDHVTQANDIYLICSDGLSDMLSNQEIGDILQDAPTNLDSTCDALVARANQNGGRDNTSVILIRVKSNQPVAGRLPQRALKWIADKAKMRWRVKSF